MLAAGTNPDLALDADGELLVQPDTDGCVLADGLVCQLGVG